MPSIGTAAVSAGVVVLVVGGLAATAGPHGITEDVATQLDQLMQSTMRDLQVGWLDVADAQGLVTDGNVTRIELLVRLAGAADELVVDELVALDGAGRTLVLEAPRPVRDADGSLDHGVLNRGDLVWFVLEVAEPLGSDTELDVSFHDPDRAPFRVELETPRYFEGQRVGLDVLRTW